MIEGGADLHDFRGTSYPAEEALGRHCDWPECPDGAVRNACNAEGDRGRTHHHGGVHRLDDGPGLVFCARHGASIQRENNTIRYLKQGGQN